MNYRREIDGLRTVAVVPVLLFHAGMPLFGGGFVGVDIFFVISGYLITSILIAEQEKGTFSIARFYERRARRILPALFFVIICCLPFAWAWMLPAQMKSFGGSIVAVSLFYSNFFFWQQNGGYFASAAEQQPMLHTWSLAVEEQFYVLFPIVIALLWRFGRTVLIGVIVLTAIVSLALAQYGSENFATANFYLPHTRAWELLAGSLCAFLLSNRHYSSNVLSLGGLALILFSIFFYDAATPFPSLFALVPVAGAAIIILFARERTLVARLLSTGPMVGIGLISYSLYLWHQPMLAFARLRSSLEPSLWTMLLICAACVPLAYCSWRFVEAPFRKGGGLTLFDSRSRIFAAAAMSMALLIGVGLFARTDDGLQSRLPPVALTALSQQKNHDPIMDECLFDKGEATLPHPVRKCLTPQSASSQTILIGDSHGAAIAGETMRAFERAGRDLYVMTHSACVNFSGFYVSDPKYRLRCNSFFTGIEKYIRSSDIKTVVMASRWSLYVEGTPYDNGEGGVESLKPTYIDVMERFDEHASEDDPDRKVRVLERYIEDIKKYLSDGYRVVLVYPIPEAGWNVPDLVAKRAMAHADTLETSTSYARYLERNGAVIAAFDTISDTNLVRVKPAETLCGTTLPERCLNSKADGEVYYFDDDHLSDLGSRPVAAAILAAVTARPAP